MTGSDAIPPGSSTALPLALTFRSEVRPTDSDNVRYLVGSTGFFSAAELEVAVELIEEHRIRGAASGYQFVFAECGDSLLGYTCYGPIPCTQASYDLYWIVVCRDAQGQGIGKALLERTEAMIREQGGGRVYIETSGRTQYAGTRAFYRRCDYQQVAWLEDFYAPGDGKVIYCKVLEPVPSGRANS